MIRVPLDSDWRTNGEGGFILSRFDLATSRRRDV